MPGPKPKPLPMHLYRRLRGDAINWGEGDMVVTGTMFRLWREMNGLSRRQVEKMTGIPDSTIGDWENGTNAPADTTPIPRWAVKAIWEWGFDVGALTLPEEDTSDLSYGEGAVAYLDTEGAA